MRFGSDSTREAKLVTYYKLKPVFDKRKRRWAGFVRSISWWIWLLVVGVLDFLLHKAHVIRTGALSHLWFYAIYYLAAIMAVRHTSLALRHSWEPSPFFVYLKDKIFPLIAGALLGILGTLLLSYFKNKYLP